MEGGKPCHRDRAAKGYRRRLHREIEARLFVGKQDVLAAKDDRNTVIVNALARNSQRPGAQPLRPAGTHSRQLQRVGGNAARSGDENLHAPH